MRLNSYSTENTQWLTDNYPTKGCIECAKYLNRSQRSIYQKARSLGLKVTSETWSKMVSQSCQVRFECQRQEAIGWQFDYTPEIAYLFGFLWADGYISKPGPWTRQARITMSKIDYLDIKRFFPTQMGRIYDSTESIIRPNHQQRVYVAISNPKLGLFLSAHDYEDKSGVAPTKILSHIPKSLHRFFWLGVSDGDGCFYVGKKQRSFSISSVHDQDWSALEDQFRQLGISTWNITKRLNKTGGGCGFGRTGVARISAGENLLKWIDYLYVPYHRIGMERKRRKAEEMKKAIQDMCQVSMK